MGSFFFLLFHGRAAGRGRDISRVALRTTMGKSCIVSDPACWWWRCGGGGGGFFFSLVGLLYSGETMMRKFFFFLFALGFWGLFALKICDAPISLKGTGYSRRFAFLVKCWLKKEFFSDSFEDFGLMEILNSAKLNSLILTEWGGIFFSTSLSLFCVTWSHLWTDVKTSPARIVTAVSSLIVTVILVKDKNNP